MIPSPHPIPVIQAQVESLRLEGASWHSIAEQLSVTRYALDTFYRPALLAKLRGAAPVDPNAPRRCGCGLVLGDGEAVCVLCELQAEGFVVVYMVCAREVREYLDEQEKKRCKFLQVTEAKNGPTG